MADASVQTVSPLVSVAIGALAAIVGGYLPGALNRRADDKQRADKAERVAAYFRGCAEHLALVAAAHLKRPLPPDISAGLDSAAAPFLAAASDSDLVTELSPKVILRVMAAATMTTLSLEAKKTAKAQSDAYLATPDANEAAAARKLAQLYVSTGEAIFANVNEALKYLGGEPVILTPRSDESQAKSGD